MGLHFTETQVFTAMMGGWHFEQTALGELRLVELVEDIVSIMGFTSEAPFSLSTMWLTPTKTGNFVSAKQKLHVKINTHPITFDPQRWDGIEGFVDYINSGGDGSDDFYFTESLLERYSEKKSKLTKTKIIKELQKIKSVIELVCWMGMGLDIISGGTRTSENTVIEFQGIVEKNYPKKQFKKLWSFHDNWLSWDRALDGVSYARSDFRREYVQQRIPALLISDIRYQTLSFEVEEIQKKFEEAKEALLIRQRFLEREDMDYFTSREREVVAPYEKRVKSIKTKLKKKFGISLPE
jgi:hypothetical protein